MQIINVDLVPGKVMPILHASQFDKGRSLGVKLYNGGAVFELSGAEDLTAAVRKPDGNIVTETLTNAGGSLVEIITTEQMTACAGGSLCEIKIENAGDVIGTANFVLEVEKDPTDGGIASQSEINNLATQVAGLVASEVEDQYDSANVIFDDEPTEGHGNGYAVTSQGIKRAIDNALNMTDTASGAIATFDTSLALPLQDCTIAINAVQESGTPTPSSPKLISGFTGANIHVADDENPHVIDNVTAITWQDEAGTVYGGSLDVTSGVLTVTHKVIDMGSLTWNTVGMGGGRTGFKSTISDIELAPAATVVFNGKCECYASLNGNDVYLGNTGIATWGANTHDIAVYDPDRESLSGNDFKTAVTGSDLVYTLQTPVTYQLTPTQISAIVGTNNVFTDTNGDTTLEYYTNKTVKDAINEVNDKADTNTTAIGDLSQLTTSDTSSLVGAVNEVNNRLGNRLVGAWTADSSTGNVQKLTDDIDVEAGTYLIIMTYPDTSANFVSCLYNSTTSSVYDNCYMSGGSWTSKAIVTAFSGNGKMCIASAQGATCNFTNKNRGSIRAIKLSNVY